MRLICPHCMSTVTVPDDAAGREAVCPNCGKPFTTPSRYAASVVPDAPAAAGAIEPARTSPHPEPPPGYAPPAPASVPAAPPGYVPPASGSGFLPPPGTSPDAPGAGYTRARGVTISPQVFSWLPAVLLLFTLVFTFFPWVGVYAGGTAIYWQQPWRAVVGSGWVGRNFALERAIAISTDWLNKVTSDWEWMVPFLLCLLVATLLAWLDRAAHMIDPSRLKRMEKVWAHRQAIIGALAAIAFIFALTQVLYGFGMQRAIRQAVNEQFAEAREKAKNDPAAEKRIEYDVEAAYRGYNIERTSWLYLALLCNLFAVLALVVRYLLARRANKPPPRLVLHY
jgi:hypothetical protein